MAIMPFPLPGPRMPAMATARTKLGKAWKMVVIFVITESVIPPL